MKTCSSVLRGEKSVIGKNESQSLSFYIVGSLSLSCTLHYSITKTHKTCRKIIVLLFFVCFWGNWRGLLCTIVFAFHSITRYYWECGCVCVCVCDRWSVFVLVWVLPQSANYYQCTYCFCIVRFWWNMMGSGGGGGDDELSSSRCKTITE